MSRLPSCDLPAAFYVALEQFNMQEYFACHETLETLWIAEKSELRQVYQGILQIAVGCYHLVTRQNWIGAVNKLNAGARRLEQWLPTMTGADLAALIYAADRLQAHLRELGRERVTEYDPRLLPRVDFRPDQRDR